MKHLFLFLAFLLPSLSFASVVPPQIPVQLNTFWASTTYTAFPFTSANVLLEYVSGSNLDYGSPYTNFYNQGYIASSPNLNTGTTSVGLAITQGCLGSSGGLPMGTSTPAFGRIIDSDLISCGTTYGTSTTDFIYINFYGMSGTGPYIYDLFAYAKFRFDGTRWVDTLGAGASGSWDFSTSTSLLPVDFTDFAQAIKDGIRNNTTVPECPAFSDILEIGNSSFWQDCVLPTIFNWLFVPSDSAIDYMIEQLSTSSQYGSSFAYMLIMPVASAVSVSACDLDNPSACDVGSPLVLPVLDAFGSSTPYSLDPVSPLPSYFDDWLSAIVAVLILAGVSRVVLHKFL